MPVIGEQVARFRTQWNARARSEIAELKIQDMEIQATPTPDTTTPAAKRALSVRQSVTDQPL
jgi:hypothetical protein